MTKTIFGKKLLILTTITVLATSLMLVAIPASAAHLICGDTVTTNTKLDADLICVGTPGLIIGAAGITIDLNGHTISGTACGFCHGIRNGDFSATLNPVPTPGFNDVTIKNGVIIGFEQGIRADTVKKFKIEKVLITGQTSSHAIDIIDSDGVTIKKVSIAISSPGPEAIRLESDLNVKVQNVHVVGGAVGVNFACFPCPDTTGPTNGVIENSSFVNNVNGILLAETTSAKVKNNVVTGSGSSAFLVGLGCFIGGFPTITGVEVSKNVVSNNLASGITLCKADGNKVKENITTGNGGVGIRLIDSDTNKMEKNISLANALDDMTQEVLSSGNIWKSNTCLTKTNAGTGTIDCP